MLPTYSKETQDEQIWGVATASEAEAKHQRKEQIYKSLLAYTHQG